jgi:hypothetical protein
LCNGALKVVSTKEGVQEGYQPIDDDIYTHIRIHTLMTSVDLEERLSKKEKDPISLVKPAGDSTRNSK